MKKLAQSGSILPSVVFQVHGIDEEAQLSCKSSCSDRRLLHGLRTRAMPGRHRSLRDIALLGARDR